MDNAMAILKAIERAEEIYAQQCDDRGQLSTGGSIETAAHLAAIECGLGASFVRGYVATRRHLVRMEPARDPFAEFAA